MQHVLWSFGRLLLWLNKVSGAIVLLESFVCRGIMGFIVLEGAQILVESHSVHTGFVEVIIVSLRRLHGLYIRTTFCEESSTIS